MNSNFHQNSFRNFNSDYFQLIPSKYITFGSTPPINRKNSGILESSSNIHENNIFFRQIPNNPSNTFKFDMEKTFKYNNNNSNNNNISIPLENKENIIKKDNPIYFKNSFQNGSKTILNSLNTCLLNLCSSPKKSQKTNIENFNNNHIINTINEDYISDIKDNDNKNKSNSFLEKVNFSPLKKIFGNKKESNYENITNINNNNISKINYQNVLTTNNLNNSYNKLYIQGAFKSMNNNYENPAKINPQLGQPFMIPMNQNFISNNIPNITKISNITNVTNNYYFQCDNPKNLLKKKTKRVQNINNENLTNYASMKKNKENINIKTPKKDNLSYGLYQLNQISVNGVSISKFPVVSMNEDDLEINLLSKMLNETDYFTIVGKYYINIPVLDEEKYNNPSYDKVFKKEKEKIPNLYLIGDNLNENNPVKLIRNFYLQIKDKILNIQKNYLSNNKKALSSNVELCGELEKLIISCNAITNTITDYKKSGLKRKLFLEHSDEDEKNKNKNNLNNNSKKEEKKDYFDNTKNDNILYENKDLLDNNNNIDDNNNSNIKKKKPKIKHFKTYLCEFCNKAYSNGQGLGGHMSRIHPNQSYKYKDKIRIRREREKKREKLLIIKQDLFKKYGYDYDKLVNDKNKTFIQQFLLEHNEEYKNIRKNQQKENKNENIYENEESKNFNNSNIFVTPYPTKINSIYEKKANYKEIINNNFSKEKTNDKTEFKINENKNTGSCGKKLGLTKLKINFELNKS